MSRVQPHPIAAPEPPAAGTASGASFRTPHSALKSVERSEIPTCRDTPHSFGSALPELLAPAGDWACAKAAVENGADAIYFGLEQFNARMRAHNFTQADLPRLVEFLHRRGVKGYVTFNTLVFENEMAEAEACLRAMIAAGVDAVVVQDAGICRLIRRFSPDFPIHVSTQMTITSAAGVEFARQLGCNLVVLARECSLKEIERLAASLPIEVFIHGALCVAYSGQCLTSEALGGRSANRGECAQACRMPYELIADGQEVPLGDRKYLLSPQDLAGLSVLPELVRIGVASLKIEGRLKSPEYVANITRIYRRRPRSSAECRARSAEWRPSARIAIPSLELRCSEVRTHSLRALRTPHSAVRTMRWRWPFPAAFTPAGFTASTTRNSCMPDLARSAASISARSWRCGTRAFGLNSRGRSSRATESSSTPANLRKRKRADAYTKSRPVR